VIKDPEPGDFVKLSGKILSICEGTALVEVYRSDPVGLRVPVQCGALEHVEPNAEDMLAVYEERVTRLAGGGHG
jgi:hypothetical protein